MRATTILPAGQWRDTPADHVVLGHDDRRRRRLAMTGAGGTSFLLDLAHTPTLVEGDGLLLEDGRVVLVKVAAEDLLELRCADPSHLTRLAYHLGNRHLEVELGDGWLRVRADHVIGDMARDLGAEVIAISAPFSPEGGAYGGHHHHE